MDESKKKGNDYVAACYDTEYVQAHGRGTPDIYPAFGFVPFLRDE